MNSRGGIGDKFNQWVCRMLSQPCVFCVWDRRSYMGATWELLPGDPLGRVGDDYLVGGSIASTTAFRRRIALLTAGLGTTIGLILGSALAKHASPGSASAR